MIRAIDIGKHFGKRTLFEGLSVHIRPHDRVGLVGANGTGKTTLFRMFTGEAEPDEGSIARRKDLRIGYLPQEIQPHDGGELLKEVVRSVIDLDALEAERVKLGDELNHASDEQAEAISHKLAALEDRFVHAGGYDIEGRAGEILSGLGFHAREFKRLVSEFSGGWHMRIELAKLLLQDLDLLLLDEPTNHLDMETIQWFEGFLAAFKGAFVLVAHDREFLNRTIKRIVEVTPNGIRDYRGNYDTYRERRVEDDALLEKRFIEQQGRIRELEDFIVRNRARKDRAAQVQSRVKMLDKIVRIIPPSRQKGIHFHFPPAPRSGESVLELRQAAKSYGQHRVFENVDLSVLRGERVALVGYNGAGKSTLLRVLADDLPLSSGERVLGHKVSVQYFAQHQLDALNLANTVQNEVEQVSTTESRPYVRSVLGAFLFSGDDADKRIQVLSGGEKSRVAIAKMLVRSANVLIMDEPTNHLDITSREVLEQALTRFAGTIIFTSHDRAFIDTVATKVIEVRDGDLHHYLGNFQYYQWKKASLEEDQPESVAPNRAPCRAPKAAASLEPADDRPREQDRDRKRREAEARNARHKLLKPLQRQLDDLETKIAYLEIQIETADKALADSEIYQDSAQVQQVNEERADAARSLVSALSRWEDVGAKVEAIQAEDEAKPE